MTFTRIVGRRLAVLAAATFIVAAGPALADLAQSRALVDAAKAQGQVGEQADGFLGIVSGGNPALTAAVAEINQGRADAYKDAATKTGVTVDAAGQATARQLLARVPTGQYYKPLDGGWTRK